MRVLPWCCFAVGLICFSGCGAAGTASEVGMSKVPVMPGSSLDEEESMPFSAGESLNNMISMTITTWRYKVDATADEIKAFYLDKYPNAEVDEYEGDDEEDEINLWINTTESLVDELTISIYDGVYSISETVVD